MLHDAICKCIQLNLIMLKPSSPSNKSWQAMFKIFMYELWQPPQSKADNPVPSKYLPVACSRLHVPATCSKTKQITNKTKAQEEVFIALAFALSSLVGSRTLHVPYMFTQFDGGGVAGYWMMKHQNDNTKSILNPFWQLKAIGGSSMFQ